MREILFKAKRIDNGEWVEGMPCATSGSGIYAIQTMDSDIFHIDQTTICQYTGLTDKNGNEIWENDVVGFLDVSQYDNGYSEHYCMGKVVWDEETLSFQVTERLSAESYEVLNDCQAIGNIFDNPELLGGADNG